MKFPLINIKKYVNIFIILARILEIMFVGLSIYHLTKSYSY